MAALCSPHVCSDSFEKAGLQQECKIVLREFRFFLKSRWFTTSVLEFLASSESEFCPLESHRHNSTAFESSVPANGSSYHSVWVSFQLHYTSIFRDSAERTNAIVLYRGTMVAQGQLQCNEAATDRMVPQYSIYGKSHMIFHGSAMVLHYATIR